MKPIIYLTTFIILVGIANAAIMLYGGEMHNFSISSATPVNITITAADTIDEGEYTFINCTKYSMINWTCNTTDGKIWMKLAPNTINTYNITFRYGTYVTTEEVTPSGGVKRKWSSSDSPANWSLYAKKNVTVNQTTTQPPVVTPPPTNPSGTNVTVQPPTPTQPSQPAPVIPQPTNTTAVPEETGMSWWMIATICIGTLLVFGAIMWWLISVSGPKEDQQNS